MFKCIDNNTSTYKIPFPSNHKLLDILLKNDAETNLKIFSIGLNSLDSSNIQVNKNFEKKYKLLKTHFNKVINDKNNEINDLQHNLKIIKDDNLQNLNLISIKDTTLIKNNMLIDSLNNKIIEYEQKINILKDVIDDEKKHLNQLISIKDETIENLKYTNNNLRSLLDKNTHNNEILPDKIMLLEEKISSLKYRFDKELEFNWTFNNLKSYLTKFDIDIDNLNNNDYNINKLNKYNIYFSETINYSDSIKFISNNNYIGGILINKMFKKELSFITTINGKLIILIKSLDLNNNDFINSINYILFWNNLYKNDNLGNIVSNTQYEFNNLQYDLNNLTNMINNLTYKSNKIKDIIFNTSTINTIIPESNISETIIETINSTEFEVFDEINPAKTLQINNYIEPNYQDISDNMINIPENTNIINEIDIKKSKTNSRKPRKNKKDNKVDI
jgi:hypothetical protein